MMISIGALHDAHRKQRGLARPATEGEEIITVMKDGHVETKNVAKAGDYVITNPTGEQYIIGGQKFLGRYNETDKPGVFSPKSAPITAVTVDRDVTFTASWGEQLHLKKGGVVVQEGDGSDKKMYVNTFRKLIS